MPKDTLLYDPVLSNHSNPRVHLYNRQRDVRNHLIYNEGLGREIVDCIEMMENGSDKPLLIRLAEAYMQALQERRRLERI